RQLGDVDLRGDGFTNGSLIIEEFDLHLVASGDQILGQLGHHRPVTLFARLQRAKDEFTTVEEGVLRLSPGAEALDRLRTPVPYRGLEVDAFAGENLVLRPGLERAGELHVLRRGAWAPIHPQAF